MTTRILAVDPGYDRAGVAILEIAHGTPTLLHSLCIQTKKTDAHAKRLLQIYETLQEAIATWSPTHIALETLFFSANKTTALKVAEARGVVILLSGQHRLELIEQSPQEVKMALTGMGNASKEQVQKMVALTLKLDIGKKLDDELDAIALSFAAAGTIRLNSLS